MTRISGNSDHRNILLRCGSLTYTFSSALLGFGFKVFSVIRVRKSVAERLRLTVNFPAIRTFYFFLLY